MKKNLQKEPHTDKDTDNASLALPSAGSRLIVAVSGGPDSVYLLMRLLALRGRHELIVSHVNHGIRGKKSDRDENFVAKLTKKHGLQYESAKITKKVRGNLEEFLRDERYSLLEDMRQRQNADWIVTAHHMNDNIETVLFNTIRGSFLEGMSGMDVTDGKRHIWRPLLQTSKEEILSYLKKHRISFCRDETNEDTSFSRNAIRKQVVPVLKRINPGFEKTAARNSSMMRDLADYLEEQTDHWFDENTEGGDMIEKSFLLAHPVLQKNIIARLYRICYGSTNKFNQAHLNQIISVVTAQKSNRTKEFGADYMIRVLNRNGRRVIRITDKSGKAASILLKKRVKEVE